MEQFLLIFLRKVDRSIDSFIYFIFLDFRVERILYRRCSFSNSECDRISFTIRTRERFSSLTDSFFEILRKRERKESTFRAMRFWSEFFFPDTILTIDRRFANVERQIVFFLAPNLIRILLNRISINFSKKNRSIHLSLEGFNFC